jgi:predicted dienelactone hydrolase
MNSHRHGHVTRRTALASALLCLALPLPARATAGAGGGFEVLDLDWQDADRARAVPVRLYLPGGAGRLPLVVFSHGIGGSRRGYSYLGSHFASHGLASLHLQHVGSDRSLWGGNPFEVLGRLQNAATDSEAVARVRDLRFALDHLLGGDLAGRIDETRIAAAGHSYGANTTLLAAGARVERDGRAVELRDERVKAAIVISAPPFHGQGDAAKILAPVTVPSLHITATEDVIRIPGYYSNADDRVRIYAATGSPHKALAVFEGGSHSIFTDRANTGGAVLNPQVKRATKELALAFLDNIFRGEHSALAVWPQRFAGLVARFEAHG